MGRVGEGRDGEGRSRRRGAGVIRGRIRISRKGVIKNRGSGDDRRDKGKRGDDGVSERGDKREEKDKIGR